MPSIWNKYKIKKELAVDQNIKTYLATFEPIIKEITTNGNNKSEIFEFFENLKDELKIYEIFEENDKLYLVVEQDEKANNRLDNILFSNEYNIKKEIALEDQGDPISKEEIKNLFNFEESICKIKFEKSINNDLIAGKCTGFFFESEIKNFPIKYCLFTNSQILDAKNLEIDKKIKFQYFTGKKYVEKEIIISDDRKIYTNKELNYTCIEIFKSDGIQKFLKIEPLLNNLKYNDFLKNKDIFILHYPKGNNVCFSYGKVKSITNKELIHSASTDICSSGAPIIIRSKENYVIGMHFFGKKGNNSATKINYILDDISKDILKPNEINCIYIQKENEKEIKLIYDYNLSKDNMNYWSEKEKKSYLEAKQISKKLFKDKIELYINDEKIKFDCNYIIKDSKSIKVKFKFKAKLTNTSYMFYNCTSLKSIDLSSFNASRVNEMNNMFYNCTSLKSIDLSSLNTSNVTDMSKMFYCCSFLKSTDLSSSNTSNVTDMSNMFYNCNSLKSIDLSSLNTSNVNSMNNMFCDCNSLKLINLTSLNISKVTEMNSMFNNCSSLESIDFSSLNTSNIINMNSMFNMCTSLKSIVFPLTECNANAYSMFYKCISLKSIDLSSFNPRKDHCISRLFYGCSSLESIDLSSLDTSNVQNVSEIFNGCFSLKKENIKINYNKNEKLYNYINNLLD